jgi:hypothetical protein
VSGERLPGQRIKKAVDGGHYPRLDALSGSIKELFQCLYPD